MPVYVDREAPKLWRKICAEVAIETSLLAENWKIIFAGVIFQYIHGLAAQGVHYMHRPGPILQDSGYAIVPELGQDKAYIIPHGLFYGCGDLIFSSHMIFTLIFVRTYHKYGTRRCIKQFAWLLAVVESFLIIASRKHYTVDVVVAWYTVNLVIFFVDKKFSELPDQSNACTSQPLLPVSTRDRDGKNKDELQKSCNGTSGDVTDYGLSMNTCSQHWMFYRLNTFSVKLLTAVFRDMEHN